VDLDLSPFNADYAHFLQSCVHVYSLDTLFDGVDSPMPFQSSLSADLVQIALLPDLPMSTDDELLVLTLADVSPVHWALHALDLHLN